MENYLFTKSEALRFGVEKAVFLYYLCHWIFTNQASGKNFNDGYYWTYNSAKTFGTVFPFWQPRKIARMLAELEEQNVIKSANFNKSSYDRTKWYTVIDQCICLKWQIEQTALTNRIDGDVAPIPDNNPDIITQSVSGMDKLQQISSGELENYSRLKKEIILNGWLGNFDKLIQRSGGISAAVMYWDEMLAISMKNVSPNCRGGFITNRLIAEAAQYYNVSLTEKQRQAINKEEMNRLKKEFIRKRLEEEHEYEVNVQAGEEIWLKSETEEKMKIFAAMKDEWDFLDGSLDMESGEIVGDNLRNQIFEQLGRQSNVHNV